MKQQKLNASAPFLLNLFIYFITQLQFLPPPFLPFPLLTSLLHLTPQYSPSLFLFREVQASNWCQQNVAYHVEAGLSFCPHIKADKATQYREQVPKGVPEGPKTGSALTTRNPISRPSYCHCHTYVESLGLSGFHPNLTVIQVSVSSSDPRLLAYVGSLVMTLTPWLIQSLPPLLQLNSLSLVQFSISQHQARHFAVNMTFQIVFLLRNFTKALN